tara:strand:+ start:633 stop:917 length:285 start_codon:yes stop_codon:yes gene_type:complete
MTERLIINVSTGSTTTETLTSDEVAARETVATENAKVLYKQKRTVGAGVSVYSGISEQLDQLYRDVAAGKFGADAKTGEWFVGITSVKTLNPKP